MDLSMIRPNRAKKRAKRLGRGVGSGWGKTAGRGHKGAGQRSGKKSPYTGHCGDNIPYARKIPKRGFTPYRSKSKAHQVVNLSALQIKAAGSKEVTPETLKELGLIKDAQRPVKILAGLDGDFTLKAIIKVDMFSKNARAIVEKAGGRLECLKR